MVVTPTFDQATALDLLTDLKATSGASVIALLDSGGKVLAVVGAPEMDQLDLGTSSLVQSALEKPSAQLWAFANKVGVLSATPVRLDRQVRALFMMGFEIEDALLADIQRAVGAAGAVFVGDGIVASASKDPEIERALRSAAELPPGGYGVVAGKFWHDRAQRTLSADMGFSGGSGRLPLPVSSALFPTQSPTWYRSGCPFPRQATEAVRYGFALRDCLLHQMAR